MTNLCQRKHQQETSEQAYNLLQRQLTHFTSSDPSVACSPNCHDLAWDTILSFDMSQQLRQHYKDIVEQSRLKIFQLYLESAKNERQTYRTNYATAEKQMWMERRFASDETIISLNMLHLIEQRCQKISDRIQCIYQYKMQSIGIEPCSSML
jgi:hypothetical protein